MVEEMKGVEEYLKQEKKILSRLDKMFPSMSEGEKE